MDKIVEMKRELAEKAKSYREFIEPILAAKRALTAEETASKDTMKCEIDDLKASIATTEETRGLLDNIPAVPVASAGRQQNPLNQPAAPAVIAQRTEDLELGISFSRYVKASVVSMREGNPFADVVKRMYPRDNVLVQSRDAMSTNAPTDGGVFVPDNLSSEIIPILRQTGVVRALGARIIPLPNGNLSIPRQTGAANFQWIGQNKPIISSKVPLGMLKLNAKKLVGLIPAANELLRDGSISADRFIRDELVSGIAESEDVTCIYGSGEQDMPIGVLNAPGVLLTPMNALPTSESTANMVGLILAQKFPGNSQFGWMFSGALWSLFYNLKDGVGNYIHRSEMKSGLFHGYPFVRNNNIVVGTDNHAMTEIYFGDWSQFIIGETMGLEIAVSQEASYWDSGALVSSFGNDQTVMRALLREDFGVRYGSAFVVNSKVYTK